jgi:hypothetical protein
MAVPTAPPTRPEDSAQSGSLFEDLQAALGPHTDFDRAAGAKAYLKSPLEHLGVSAAGIRTVSKQLLQLHPKLSNDDLVQFALGTFCPPEGNPIVYDHRAVSVGMLELRARTLEIRHLDAIVLLFPLAATWALVDWLAIKVVGPILLRHPDPKVVLEAWTTHPDIWVRRAALLSPLEHLRSGKGDLELFFGIAECLIDERSFWIQKAIGWVLRDCSRKRPQAVRGFADRLGPRLHGLARREALRNMPPLVSA